MNDLKKSIAFFTALLILMVGVNGQNTSLNPPFFDVHPQPYPDTPPNVTIQPYPFPYVGTIDVTHAWFKTIHFPDGTKVVADRINDELFVKNQTQKCFRVSGDEETDSMIFALNEKCFQQLPIYIVEPYLKWGFNTQEPTHDFTFQCNDWVCELSLKTAWNDYYGRQEYMAISQDFDDLAIVTSTSRITLSTSEYSLRLPKEQPEIGQCMQVVEFVPNRTYLMEWRNC